MSTDLHARVLAWLTEEFSKKEHRQITKVWLCYAPAGLREETLKTWERSDQPELFESVVFREKLAGDIVEAANDYADTFGMGKHPFVVRTKEHIGALHSIRFSVLPSASAGAAPDDIALVAAGGSNGRGNPSADALTTLTANNQALMRSNQAMFQTSFATLAGLAEGLREENIKLKAENADLRVKLDTASSTKEEREFKIALEAEEQKRKHKNFDDLIKLGHLVAVKVTGGGSVPGAPTPLTHLLQKFGESLTQDQVMRMLPILEPAQQAMFFEIMKMVTPDTSTGNAA